MQIIIARTKGGRLIQGTFVAKKRGLVRLTNAIVDGIPHFTDCDVLVDEKSIVKTKDH